MVTLLISGFSFVNLRHHPGTATTLRGLCNHRRHSRHQYHDHHCVPPIDDRVRQTRNPQDFRFRQR